MLRIGKLYAPLLALGLLGAPAPAEATVVERVVAIVGERVLLLSDLRERAGPFLSQIHQSVPPGAQRSAAISQLYKGLLERMVDEEIEQRAAIQAKVSVTAREVEEALGRVAAQNGIPVEKLLAEARRTGLDDSEYRDELRRQLLQTKLINVRLQGRIRVTEDDLRQAYRQIEIEEREKLAVRAAWIFVAVPPGASPAVIAERRAFAERLSRDAARADFAELVRTHSDDLASKRTGGELARAKAIELPPALKRLMVSLEPGQVSGAVRVNGGFGVFKLLEREEGSLPTFEESVDELSQRVYMDKMTRARRNWLDSLRRQQHVEVRL
jgi:peptidyl-prolyl cis-trans isomerase SurA